MKNRPGILGKLSTLNQYLPFNKGTTLLLFDLSVFKNCIIIYETRLQFLKSAIFRLILRRYVFLPIAIILLIFFFIFHNYFERHFGSGVLARLFEALVVAIFGFIGLQDINGESLFNKKQEKQLIEIRLAELYNASNLDDKRREHLHEDCSKKLTPL